MRIHIVCVFDMCIHLLVHVHAYKCALANMHTHTHTHTHTHEYCSVEMEAARVSSLQSSLQEEETLRKKTEACADTLTRECTAAALHLQR